MTERSREHLSMNLIPEVKVHSLRDFIFLSMYLLYVFAFINEEKEISSIRFYTILKRRTYRLLCVDKEHNFLNVSINFTSHRQIFHAFCDISAIKKNILL